jgi:hypothetical protein
MELTARRTWDASKGRSAEEVRVNPNWTKPSVSLGPRVKNWRLSDTSVRPCAPALHDARAPAPRASMDSSISPACCPFQIYFKAICGRLGCSSGVDDRGKLNEETLLGVYSGYIWNYPALLLIQVCAVGIRAREDRAQGVLAPVVVEYERVHAGEPRACRIDVSGICGEHALPVADLLEGGIDS